MSYKCSVCQKQVDGDVVRFQNHTEKHIIDLIKHDHPDWIEAEGACRKCAEYYRAEMKGSFFQDVPCVLRNRKIKSFWQKIKDTFVTR